MGSPSEACVAAQPPPELRADRTRERVTYPYGRTLDGRVVHVREEHHKGEVLCFGCDGVMVAKRGGRAWHFAHHRLTVNCSNETALHHATKALIVDVFRDRKAVRRPYELTWTCKGCRCRRSVDIVAVAADVWMEFSLTPDTVADVAFRGARWFAVEVVVTHPPEPETLARYESSDIPVFIVRPSWETIDGLRERIDATEALFTHPRSCRECVARAEQRERREAAERDHRRCEQREFNEKMGRVLEALASNTQCLGRTDPFVKRWTTDRSGRAMPDDEVAARYVLARRIARLGFSQSPDIPWLFTLHVPELAVFRLFLGAARYRKPPRILPVTLSWASSFKLPATVVNGMLDLLRRVGVYASVSLRMLMR